MEVVEKATKRLLSKVEAYKKLTEELSVLEVERAELGAELLLAIPAGSELEGLQHQVSTRLKPDERELRRLGHWSCIVKEAVDNDKLKALVKLHPELLSTGAVEAASSDRLVVKRGE